jgi:hypothetical protein
MKTTREHTPHEHAAKRLALAALELEEAASRCHGTQPERDRLNTAYKNYREARLVELRARFDDGGPA